MNTRLHSVCALVACIRRLPQIAFATLLVFAFLGAPTVRAQSNVQGYIYGSASGAAPGTTVTVENSGTGLKRTVTTDSTGDYSVPSLPTGQYSVTLKSPGKPDQVNPDVTVNVGAGTAANFGQTAEQTTKMEKYVVMGSTISPIDVSRVESVTILQSQTIEQIPVERNSTAVALLAPGTSQGIAAFGNLVSFGGSSVAENAYYVNGFNLTNFRTGLGGGTVPFEFYDQFEVKTGGYGAEFGRSTGGVINATTKSGSNTFHAGANVYFEPNALQTQSPITSANGVRYSDTTYDYDQNYSFNVYASGALIKNKLFYYGLYNVRDTKHRDAHAISTFYTSTSKDPFWGGKIDWNITDQHTLSFTAISDKRTINQDSFAFTDATGAIGASRGPVVSERGGRDYIANYTGQLTSDLTVTALFGKGTAAGTDTPQGLQPYIYDGRTSPAVTLSGSSARPTTLNETRKSYRLDFTYHFNALGSHSLRFGYDREDMTSVTATGYAMGGIYYRYYPATNATKVNGVTVPAGTTQYVREQVYGNSGAFATVATAPYLEDNWKVMDDRLLLSLGVRSDEFNNKNMNGQSFVHLKNQWGPRLGATFDVNKDGKSKIFANWGRYTMPVANNTNIRFSGGEVYSQDYYVLTSVDPTTKLPVVGAHLGPIYYLPQEDGLMRDPKTIVNQDMKPMYQDEFIAGYQTQLNKDWTAGVRGTYRTMTHFIEDIGVDLIPGDDSTYSDILTNPGQTLNVWQDLGDGKGLRQFILQPSQQGYGGKIQPLATRKYYAAEFFFERINNGKWWLQGSYTLSHSYGNDEGSVLSDVAQVDNGLTQLFDYPQIMEGAYGNLNNDRRHKFKLFGAYKLTDEIQLAANLLVQSGTPKVVEGYYPGNDANLANYGAAYHYINGVMVPRGSLGNQPMMKQLDLSVKYTPKWGEKKLSFGMDVFNVFNSHTVTETFYTAENGSSGVPNPQFLTPTQYQTPVYVRFSASYKY